MDDDLALLSGEFLEGKVPKKFQYLEKYFPEHIQKIFLSYIVTFQKATYISFQQHTGTLCTKRWWFKLHKRFLDISKLDDTMRNNIDLESMQKLHSGKLKLSSLGEKKARYSKP